MRTQAELRAALYLSEDRYRAACQVAEDAITWADTETFEVAFAEIAARIGTCRYCGWTRPRLRIRHSHDQLWSLRSE